MWQVIFSTYHKNRIGILRAVPWSFMISRVITGVTQIIFPYFVYRYFMHGNLTTHYISEAEELCDYIYVLDKGRMIAQGTKEELKDLFVSEPKMVLQEPGLEEILMKIIYRSRGENSEENIFGNKSRN